MRIPVIALLAISAVLCPAQDRLADTLRRGIVQEETRQDLNGAIKSYEAVLAQFGQIAKPGATDRKTAATALFRIAECQRKQGRTEQAAASYRRILNEFGDQEQLVAQSRTHIQGSELRSDVAAAGQEHQRLTLTAPYRRILNEFGNQEQLVAQSGVYVGRSEAPSDAAAAEQEYRRLLNKARESLAMKRAYTNKQYELGALSQLDLQNAQKEFLEDERRIMAYETGVQFTQRTPANGATDEARNHYRAVLLQQIVLARTALDTAKKKNALGAIDFYSLNDVESALTDLELELAAFDASQGASKGKR